MTPRLILAALLLCTAPCHAELTRLDITSTRSFGQFATGEYVLWEGRVHGDLAPTEPIPGLDKAVRNPRGRVDYSAKLTLILPREPARGNGTLLVDVPNRGKPYAIALYNSPRGEPFQSGVMEQGNGFLQDRGFSVAEVSWELGQGAELPSFVDAEGKRRFVEGAGFAIFRDAAAFLARGSADAQGTPNPLRGAVKHLIATGKSQSGRFLKSFLAHGFNRVDGRPLFHGMHVFVASAGQLPIMTTGAGPESSSNAIPTWDNPDLRGNVEDPTALADVIAQVERRGEAVPRIMFVNSSTDYYAIRASLGRTGSSGAGEKPLPPQIRVYDIAGSAHAIVPRAPAECQQPPGRLDWTPVSRALLLRLNAWVSADTPPPASRLMPLEPAPEVAMPTPGHLPQAVTLVPKRDADGNDLGGVRLPDLEVPLGTHVALNRPLKRACMLIGAWSPFAATVAQREQAKDARPSLAERYGSRDAYVNRVRASARAAIADGFLLPEDAALIIESAATTQAFTAAGAAGDRQEVTGRP
jgi:hypothetical protein